jgi:CheY-like chemotaxis protein
MKSRNVNVMLVEDDENDVLLLRLAFNRVGADVCLRVAKNGQEAIDYLSGAGQYSDRREFPLPGLMFLDLKLPLVMGFEVLSRVREQPCLCGLVVVILTSSSMPCDIQEAYQLRANSYLVKPVSHQARIDMARAIKSFWLEGNWFPSPYKMAAAELESTKFAADYPGRLHV